jgi:hypothetical protein
MLGLEMCVSRALCSGADGKPVTDQEQEEQKSIFVLASAHL